MTSKAATRPQDSRSEMERTINGIEHDRGWQCYWQHKTPGDRRLVEYMFYPAGKTMLLVVKDFDGPIRGGKTWPKMVGCEVFAPIGGHTWDGLNAALDKLEAKD